MTRLFPGKAQWYVKIKKRIPWKLEDSILLRYKCTCTYTVEKDGAEVVKKGEIKMETCILLPTTREREKIIRKNIKSF